MAPVARRTPRKDQEAQRRRSQLTGAVGVLVAAALPVVLWHDVVADIAAVSQFDTMLVAGWAPWVLMALGLLCVVPIAMEHLRNRDRRFHRPGSGAWVGWGITLYLLGFGLASQVAQIQALHA